MRSVFIVMIFMMLISVFSASSSVDSTCDQGDLTIGALLPLSGDYSSIGLSAQNALEHAEADISGVLADMSRSTRIHIVVNDTRADPEVALEALKELQVQGVRIIIGPEDSASLSRLREYANASGIILISGSSTAPSLAIANDTTFRMASDDGHLAEAMVALMLQDGIKAVVPLARDDLWGDDMIKATEENLESEGGVMLDPVRYPANTADFQETITELGSALDQAGNEYGNDSVAVYLVASNETVDILSQANGDAILSSARWYGSDPSGVLVRQDEEAAAFAIKAGFVYPTFGQQNSDVYRKIAEDFRQRHGMEMVSYAINDYDAAWLIAYTYLVAGSDDPAILGKMLPLFARTYRGYSGDAALNNAGDRAFAIYTFWRLNETDGTLQNEPISKYVYNPSEGAFWSDAGVTP